MGYYDEPRPEPGTTDVPGWPGNKALRLRDTELDEIRRLCATRHPHESNEYEVFLALHATLKHIAWLDEQLAKTGD